ncbi:flagellin/flagellar hook associated protein [Salinisphaera dokdonensis CL-ES53]|uniref:Flagellin n=1 Tax=Salinisphaera dokdonensis CL-ES53 TaxID=1304272 RepID=A0ABV2AY99_9GAMM
MSFVINANTLSLTAQSNLNASQKSLNSAIERLPSGSKITSAKDDAAGQAISNRMPSQINGLKQASSNANDGISLAQTTEGALNQGNDNLQRVRELPVQAANGTNSQSDLESIQNEIDQRLGEIDRISEQTAFNGTNVLDGSKTAIDIQVGSKDGETITINLAKMDAESLSLDGFNVDGSGATTFDATTSALGANKALVSYTDGEGKTAYAIEDSSAGAGSETYTGATIDKDGVASDTGTSLDSLTSADATTINDTNAVSYTSQDPLAALDSALKQVDDLRSDLGAVQNRMDSAINNIDTTQINISSARSRIVDADYATEVSNMSKAQILQQAGTSVLAQANQTSQGVLSLLG